MKLFQPRISAFCIDDRALSENGWLVLLPKMKNKPWKQDLAKDFDDRWVHVVLRDIASNNLR